MNIYDAAKILDLKGNISPMDTKKAFLAACKKYHPDVNPAGESMMKIVNQAFDALKDYEGELKEQSQNDYGEDVNAALNAIHGLEGLIIEICGAWLWVTGETRSYSKILKEAGFFWASKKKAWYFRPEGFKSRSKGSASLDQIRDKYGSQRPQKQSMKYISA